jgi:hypothetical protein
MLLGGKLGVDGRRGLASLSERVAMRRMEKEEAEKQRFAVPTKQMLEEIDCYWVGSLA